MTTLKESNNAAKQDAERAELRRATARLESERSKLTELRKKQVEGLKGAAAVAVSIVTIVGVRVLARH